MALKLYMDHHIPREVTNGLRLRRVDVLTAFEDHTDRLQDPDLLDRATTLRRVLFTRDSDLLIEAKRRQESGGYFFGVIYAHQLRATIGQCIQDLELITQIADESDTQNTVIFLPL